jgi:hypothetical protein
VAKCRRCVRSINQGGKKCCRLRRKRRCVKLLRGMQREKRLRNRRRKKMKGRMSQEL